MADCSQYQKACGNLKKENPKTIQLGSIEVTSRFQMGFINLHHTKKGITVWIVSNFREINKQIVRKPFPIPKIITVLQELEGFTYATALDLNISYYTIRLDPDASKMCTIILPWEITLTSGYQCVLHVLPTSCKLRCLS